MTGVEMMAQRLERKIDVLIAGVATGFERIDARFERIDARFERIDARFDQVDSRFDRVEKYLKSIEKTQGIINGELSDAVADHEQRLASVEKKV